MRISSIDTFDFEKLLSGYSLAEAPRQHVRERPDKPALVFENSTLTYREFDSLSSQAANALRAAGIGAGDRVAFIGKNVPEYFPFTYGAAKINAVSVGVNWRLTPHEISLILEDAEVKLIVVEAEFLGHLDSINLSRNPKIVSVGGDGKQTEFSTWISEQSDIDPGIKPDLDDTAVQVYTSGTTGKPKGAELTHRNLGASFLAFSTITNINSESIPLNVLPMFHIGGSSGAFLGLWCGCTSIIHRELDPAKMLTAIAEHGVTNLMVVPAVLQQFPLIPGARDLDFSSVKLVNYGASPISEDVLNSAIDLFGCPLLQSYGMTEATGPITHLPPEDHDPRGPRAHLMRSAGRPVPGTEIRILRKDGTDANEGEVGEIFTRSYQTMKGYWKNSEATDKAFPKGRDADGRGWMATGDAGAIEDGYLFIRDRVKDMIISGGENIYPAEIENTLMSHPSVADVAVIGIPSERWGESPLAVIVPEAGHDPSAEDIIAFCGERLARYKLPVAVKNVAEIPRNASGKIQKVALRKPYWGGKERAIN